MRQQRKASSFHLWTSRPKGLLCVGCVFFFGCVFSVLCRGVSRFLAFFSLTPTQYHAQPQANGGGGRPRDLAKWYCTVVRTCCQCGKGKRGDEFATLEPCLESPRTRRRRFLEQEKSETTTAAEGDGGPSFSPENSFYSPFLPHSLRVHGRRTTKRRNIVSARGRREEGGKEGGDKRKKNSVESLSFPPPLFRLLPPEAQDRIEAEERGEEVLRKRKEGRADLIDNLTRLSSWPVRRVVAVEQSLLSFWSSRGVNQASNPK